MPAATVTPPEIALRPARREDAADMARLVGLASEGLTDYLWAQMAAPGEDPFAVGVRRAERDDGAFSWRNAVVAEVDGAVAGMLVAYRVGDEPEPVDEQPEMFRPLQRLENRALGTHYVNVLATYPEFRRRGVATRLLREAERQGEGAAGLSLIVASANAGAQRLYEGFGFVKIAEEKIVKEGWESDSDRWMLMVKRLEP
jgi:ribosomal protein S18 acetylase RimI-like enzyme